MEENKQQKKKINIKFIIILGALVILGGGYGVYKYLHSLSHEVTDDAQVDSKITPVIPKVSGYIEKILVQDNQMVHKGDTLVVIDQSEYALKLQEAKAALLQAEGQLSVAHANVNTAGVTIGVTEAGAVAATTTIETAKANVETAKVQVWRTKNDYDRYNKLYKNQSITKQQYEQALAAKETAERQLQVANAQLAATTKQAQATSQQVNTSKAQSDVSKAQIKVAEAAISQYKTNIANAELYLSYTYVIAAEDGQLSKINLQPGQFVQAGQSLFNIVNTKQIYVTANYKETQLEKIRVGQEAIIVVDAYPHHEFKGKVTSLSPATGAKFALLPPDNASGNFVKTVQRLPIKIEFTDEKDDMLKLIRPGMNVEADILLKSNTTEK
ncbi:HlyD family secretion protein [Chishuiella sp.]|uniref:HlyD family secretion protein n=1 Tax=Chishuiella sp. TaxID=1969467 RepID=UPI0028AEEAC3|nr:HlyD family secretion protein [Chishuiella sp.]